MERKEMEYRVLKSIDKMSDKDVHKAFYDSELDVEYPKMKDTESMRRALKSNTESEISNLSSEKLADFYKGWFKFHKKLLKKVL